MATIPRANRATSVPRSPRGPRASRIDVSSGFKQFSALAEGLANNMIQQRRTNQLAQKKIEIYKRLGTLESDISLGKFSHSEETGFALSEEFGGDYSKAPDAFNTLSGDIRAEVLDGISDSQVRNAVSNEFDMVQAQKLSTVRNSAVKKMRDATVAELDVNTELFARAFSEATTTAERLQIRDAFIENLHSAEATGAIDKQELVKRSQDFRNTVAELGVRKDLLGATRDSNATEDVLNTLRDPGGYPGLTPEARQSFEEQALRQFNSAIDFEFRIEDRRERQAARTLKKNQLSRTQELAALIRPVTDVGFGEPKIGHVEIDRAFQLGEITAAQTNYLRSLIERPDPTPDPYTRFSYLAQYTQQAYEGTLETNDVLRARTAGYLEDSDVQSLISIDESREAAGGPVATTDAKQALEFLNSYLFGVKSIFQVQLTDDKVRRIGTLELLFNGAVGRGENPYRVASEIIQDESRAAVKQEDIPPQVRGLFLEHRKNGTLSQFWDDARTRLEESELSLTQRRSLIKQLELLRNTKSAELERLPEVLEELRVRAENLDRRAK